MTELTTNLYKAKCGHCGYNEFSLFQSIKDPNEITVQCLQCYNTSIIGISKPQLQIKWGDQSDGIIHFSENN
jgi:hypothetical protein